MSSYAGTGAARLQAVLDRNAARRAGGVCTTCVPTYTATGTPVALPTGGYVGMTAEARRLWTLAVYGFAAFATWQIIKTL